MVDTSRAQDLPARHESAMNIHTAATMMPPTMNSAIA
jgi:hypothetical protein